MHKWTKITSKYLINGTLVKGSKSQFIEMFGTIAKNEKGFPLVAMNEACIKITDGKHGGCFFQDNSGFYFVGAREIFDDEIHYASASQISEEDFYKDYKRCDLTNGDLVIVNTGATIGKTAIASSSLTSHTLLQKSVAIMRTKKEQLLPIFLKYCYSANPDMYRVSSASAQPNLLLSRMKSTRIYLPPIELQNEFARFVEQTDKSKVLIEKRKSFVNTPRRVVKFKKICYNLDCDISIGTAEA